MNNKNLIKPHKQLRFFVQITEYCDLNCNNCAHYAPLASHGFINIYEYEKDLARLSCLFGGEAEYICLMGGEPLLNPDICKIISITKKAFPIGKIEIVTNGLKLTQMQEYFFEVCKENNIEICVSKYPLSMDYSFLEQFVRSKGLSFRLYGGHDRRPTMARFLIDPRGKYDQNENFYTCPNANTCISLRSGKLYTCATIAHVGHLQNYFNLDIDYEHDNGIDIYKINSAAEIMERLAKPFKFCRYCDHKYRYIYEDDWCVSLKDRYEWISFTFSKDDMEYLKRFPHVYVFGAGTWAIETVDRLTSAEIHVNNILVNSKKGIFDRIDGISVIDINNCVDLDRNGIVLLTVNNGKEKIDAQHILRGKGFERIIPIMKLD